MESLRPCPDCGSTGSIWKEKVQIPCSYCGGTGRIKKDPNQIDLEDLINAGDAA